MPSTMPSHDFPSTDFSLVIDRRNSHSLKWERYRGQDILPLWVADMDFAVPANVLSALHKRIQHPIFGYTTTPPELVGAFQHHAKRLYQWSIQPDWLLWLPGLVCALNVACRLFSGTVFTATPIYPPFLSAPNFAQRRLCRIPLLEPQAAQPATDHMAPDTLQWRWDWDALETQLQEAPADSVLLLCHPHNPVGRVWRADELSRLAALTARYRVTVVSDEIHCDLPLTANPHTPFAHFADNAITLMAPSKTYNVPGLGCSVAIIPDARLRARFNRAMAGIVPHVNTLGFTAACAAWGEAESEVWRQGLLAVLRQNHELVFSTVSDLPHCTMSRAEATYLAWIDVRSLQLSNAAAYFAEHGLGLSDGSEFAAPGFVRLNFACPTATLNDALQRFRHAVLSAPPAVSAN